MANTEIIDLLQDAAHQLDAWCMARPDMATEADKDLIIKLESAVAKLQLELAVANLHQEGRA
jgi:hypothetical protein